MNPNFVIFMGDLIDGYKNDSSNLNKEWDEILCRISSINKPTFLVPGNHDISNQIAKNIWEDRFGPSMYYFKFNESLFIVLDTEDPPVKSSKDEWNNIKKIIQTNHRLGDAILDIKNPANLSIDQVTKVQEILELDENRYVDWIYVFMHKPFWKDTKNYFRFIEETLSNNEYSVFSAHKHLFQAHRRNGRDFIEVGSAGGGLFTEENIKGNYHHILWVSYKPGIGPVYTNISIDGFKDVY